MKAIATKRCTSLEGLLICGTDFVVPSLPIYGLNPNYLGRNRQLKIGGKKG